MPRRNGKAKNVTVALISLDSWFEIPFPQAKAWEVSL